MCTVVDHGSRSAPPAGCGGSVRRGSDGAAQRQSGRPRAGSRKSPDGGIRTSADPLARGSRVAQSPSVPLPEDADPSLLDPAVRAELRGLAPATAQVVAGHLVAAGLLLDDEPELAYEHVQVARARAARIGTVRETAGIVAYRTERWAEALGEFRAARRISGDGRWLAVMADCERALGRPERALKVLADPALASLDVATQIEVLIVVAGARSDLGQPDAALLVLSRGGLDRNRPREGSSRLWYAYADTLAAMGRQDEAREWFAAAAGQDPDEETDAAERAGRVSSDRPAN